jgi:hypothetical protein
MVNLKNDIAFTHAKKSIKRIERAGIDVALVGIQLQTVKDLHPCSVVVNALEELPRTAMKQLRTLLTS